MVKAQRPAARSVLLREQRQHLARRARATRSASCPTRWDPERMDALLLLVPHTRARNFRRQGRFPHGRARAADAAAARAGSRRSSSPASSWSRKRLLRDAPEGPFSTNVLWDRAIEEGRLYGAAFTGAVVRGRRPAGDRADRGGAGAVAERPRPASLFDRRAPRLCRCAGGRAGAALSPIPSSASPG